MSRIFDNWLDAFMEYSDNCESAKLLRYWTGISAIASVLKRKSFLEWHTRLYPNLYIVLVSPSGGRKGTAMKWALPMLETLNIKMAAEAITREALIRELSKSTDSYLTATGETFHHCSLTIHAQELAVFLGQSNLQLLSDLTDWYDCRSMWTYRTKNVGTDIIEGVWVNLLGAITPSILQNSLPQDAIGGGLTSRMLFIYAPGMEKAIPLPFRTQANIELGTLLTQELETIGLLHGAFKPSEEMLDTYASWYTQHVKSPPMGQEAFAGYNERKATHLLKLSMIMSASRSSSMEISVEDFKKSRHALGVIETYMPKVFQGYGRRENADVLQHVIDYIIGKGKVGRKEIVRRFMADLTFMQIDEVVNTLCESGLCRKILNPDGEIVVEYKGE